MSLRETFTLPRILFFIVPLLFISAFWGPAVCQYSHEKAVMKWPWVKGAIIEIHIKEERDDESFYFCGYIHYTYTVNKIKLKNNKYSPGQTVICKKKKNELKLFLKQFKLNQKISVFYNPKNPKKSYMHMPEGLSAAPYLLFGLGAFIFIIFALMAVFFVREEMI